jgi:NTE family protein
MAGWRRRRWLGGALTLLAGAGVSVSSFRATHDHDGPDVPYQQAWARPFRVAWVLSSGGPRAFVHVGVIRALDELGLQPDLIVGASAGALVGVMRAAGHRGQALQDLALTASPWRVMRLNPFGPPWLSGDALASWVRDGVGGRPLQALDVPVACVAWRPSAQALVAFNQGDAGLAVQASSAIEDHFSPVLLNSVPHVDADLHQPLPVRLARRLGAQRVLAVDASAHEDRAPEGTEAWRAGDLRKRALTEPDARTADLLLHPDTGYYAGFSRDYRERVMDIGYRETMARAAELRALHAG